MCLSVVGVLPSFLCLLCVCVSLLVRLREVLLRFVRVLRVFVVVLCSVGSVVCS